MFAKCKVAVLSLALIPSLASISHADGFGITWMQRFHHGLVSLGFSSGTFLRPTCFVPICEPRCAPAGWVPGHYEIVNRQVFVEGCFQKVWVQPVYAWQTHGCGRSYRECVRPGRFEFVRSAGRYETRPFEVWVDGAWRSS